MNTFIKLSWINYGPYRLASQSVNVGMLEQIESNMARDGIQTPRTVPWWLILEPSSTPNMVRDSIPGN